MFLEKFNSLLLILTFSGSTNYPWSLEDNHNDFRACKNHSMQNEYHCWWFHCLYDHNHLSWDDMLRIGDFWSDLKVTYQYFD